MKTPRHIAAEALLKIEQRGAWSNLTLDSLLQTYSLQARDAVFVSALFYGVLERRITLDACIAAHSKQPLDKLSPAVLAALRLGIYQLLYMESVPDSAAVHESVELVKHLRKAQAAGFVNGILRAFLRADQKIPVPQSPLSEKLSVRYSCSPALAAMWLESYGPEATEQFLSASLGVPPLYLRVNTVLISAEELVSRLRAHGMDVQIDPDLPDCLVAEGAGAVQKLPEYRRGFFHVQDKSSQLCALSLGVQPGMRVLDCCAAPGGKTFTLMQMMQNQGEVVATDLHEHRVALIAKRAKQMQLTGITPLAADMTSPLETLGIFDRVLCDVPCSGFGVIRRKPEIKYKPLEEIENLPELQYKILQTAAQYCQVGGQLLYSTCTLNPAENQQVAARFLQTHPEFVPAPLPDLLGGTPARTILNEWNADGFYLALFCRV